MFVADRPMRVGTIALGYADGYLRCWSGKGVLTASGRSLPALGRVSMDMTVIDLSAAPEIGEGDWVEVAYRLPDAATASGLSQYELLTLLGSRFGR
jgi:alanine racemase